MCGEELKDLKHFILWCPAYDEERGKDTNFQRPYKRNEELLGELLFENELKYSTKQTIYAFWKIREKKREQKDNWSKKIEKKLDTGQGRKNEKKAVDINR